MPSSDKPQNREEKALQALISAALHAKSGDVSLDEIQPYLQGNIQLSPEDEAALAASRKVRPTPAPSEQQEETAESEALMALHRKRPAGGFSVKTEEEIKRKREELLERLRKKKGCS